LINLLGAMVSSETSVVVDAIVEIVYKAKTKIFQNNYFFFFFFYLTLSIPVKGVEAYYIYLNMSNQHYKQEHDQELNFKLNECRIKHYYQKLSAADFCDMAATHRAGPWAAQWQDYAKTAKTQQQRQQLKDIAKNSVCQADLDRVSDDDLSWGPSAEAVWNNSYRIIDELSADDVTKHLTLWDSIRSLDLHTCDKENMICMGYVQGFCWDLEGRLTILSPR
jgi:hypothetical protein